MVESYGRKLQLEWQKLRKRLRHEFAPHYSETSEKVGSKCFGFFPEAVKQKSQKLQKKLPYSNQSHRTIISLNFTYLKYQYSANSRLESTFIQLHKP